MAHSAQDVDRAPPASGGTPPLRVGGRFTRENAAYYGRRGAAARDRKFLERFRRPEEIRRAERAEFRWALAVVYQVFGSPRRPRRTLAHPEDRIEELREALSILGRNLDVGPTRDRLRAIDAIFHVWFHPRFLDPVFVPGNPFGIPLGVILTAPQDRPRAHAANSWPPERSGGCRRDSRAWGTRRADRRGDRLRHRSPENDTYSDGVAHDEPTAGTEIIGVPEATSAPASPLLNWESATIFPARGPGRTENPIRRRVRASPSATFLHPSHIPPQGAYQTVVAWAQALNPLHLPGQGKRVDL